MKKSLRDTRVDFQETAKVQEVQMAPLSRRPQEPSDFLILYSLVRDRVLPQDFGEAFSGLEQAANLAADRSLPLVSPTCSLRVGFTNGTNKPHSSRSSTRQPQTSSCLQRTRHRDGFDPSSNQGPNARKEAEETERTKWIELLVRCWLTRPHQWVPCWQHRPAIYSS